MPEDVKVKIELPPEWVDVTNLVNNLVGALTKIYSEAGLTPPNPFIFDDEELKRLFKAMEDRA